MHDSVPATAFDAFADGNELPESSAVESRYGRLLTIRSDEFASESVRRYGEWAQQELDLVGSLLTPGDWILDGGAYIGTHTLAFSCFVGPSGQVLSVEPRREVFRLLRANVEEVNRLGNVHLLNVALGDHQGSLDLRLLTSDAERANPGGQPIADIHDAVSAYPVKVVTLDSLDLQRLDFLKLDVEGAEASIVTGARETIRRHRPFVFVELNSITLGAEVLSAMREHDGYQAFGSISAAFNPRNHNGSTENIFGDAVETALLFVPENKLDRLGDLAMSFRLTPVYNLDEVALVLLHKPQYASEILESTAAGHRLGLSYPSPLAQRLIQEHTADAAVHAAALTRLTRDHAKEVAARTRAHADDLDAKQQEHSCEINMCRQAHAREFELCRHAHALEIESLKQAQARRDELCRVAHSDELSAVRAAADAQLAAAGLAAEKALREQADSFLRAHSKQIVALTTGHVERLRAVSCELEMKVVEATKSVQAAHDHIEQQGHLLAALYASRSWQFTAPLRRAATILRRAAGRGTGRNTGSRQP